MACAVCVQYVCGMCAVVGDFLVKGMSTILCLETWRKRPKKFQLKKISKIIFFLAALVLFLTKNCL